MRKPDIACKQAAVTFCCCLAGWLLAMGIVCAAVRFAAGNAWVALIAGGVLLQIISIVLYAATRRRKRFFCVVEICLNTVGTGFIMAAHPVAEGFRMTAETLLLAAAPLALLFVAYAFVFCLPWARKWCGILCAADLLLLIVMFGVLWGQNGPARFSIPLYGTIFVLFYAATLVPEAVDLKTCGDYLFFSSLGALIIILILVLAAISGGDGCDGDCCECCDCAPDTGGRRKGRKYR